MLLVQLQRDQLDQLDELDELDQQVKVTDLSSENRPQPEAETYSNAPVPSDFCSVCRATAKKDIHFLLFLTFPKRRPN